MPSLLFRYFGEENCFFKVTFPGQVWLEVGDEVRLDGAERPLGEVDALLDAQGHLRPAICDWCGSARIRVFDKEAARLHSDASARLVRVPQTAAWVVQTLFTEKTIPRIAAEWNQTMLEHREEIFELVTPIVRDLILDLERHIEKELPPFLERHRSEVREIGEPFEGELAGKKLGGVIEQRLWPIVQPKLKPIVEKVSQEIWDKLPLWSLSWRFAYQTLPLTDNDYVVKAWARFLEEQAVPILKTHSEEILKATQDIVREFLTTRELSDTFRQAFAHLLESPKFQSLCQVFLREVFLDNAAFHQAMLARWSSPEVKRALEAASAQIEPMVRRMGDIVLGTRQEGITREFARVLRSQILLKDLERLVIHPGSEGSPCLAEGGELKATVEWEIKN